MDSSMGYLGSGLVVGELGVQVLEERAQDLGIVLYILLGLFRQDAGFTALQDFDKFMHVLTGYTLRVMRFQGINNLLGDLPHLEFSSLPFDKPLKVIHQPLHPLPHPLYFPPPLIDLPPVPLADPLIHQLPHILFDFGPFLIDGSHSLLVVGMTRQTVDTAPESRQ